MSPRSQINKINALLSLITTPHNYIYSHSRVRVPSACNINKNEMMVSGVDCLLYHVSWPRISIGIRQCPIHFFLR
jgi:hypothetical protein